MRSTTSRASRHRRRARILAAASSCTQAELTAALSPDDHARLAGVLAEARERGFLGPGPVEPHIAHALGFAAAATTADPPPARAYDLGSGGGLPGLPLAVLWPASTWFLVESMARRSAFLREVIAALDLAERVHVIERRAEEVGRDDAHRSAGDLVVARSFGPPAVVAECAAPLLRIGGLLVVSEPPARSDRWPADGLASVGLAPDATPSVDGYARMRQVSSCPDRYPRRVGVPAKRPLWGRFT